MTPTLYLSDTVTYVLLYSAVSQTQTISNKRNLFININTDYVFNDAITKHNSYLNNDIAGVLNSQLLDDNARSLEPPGVAVANVEILLIGTVSHIPTDYDLSRRHTSAVSFH